MNPNEIADVAERIAAIAVELVKQVATPLYNAALTKVIVTNQVGLWACGILAVILGLLIAVFASLTKEDDEFGWAVFLFSLGEIATVIYAAICIVHIKSAEYWAFVLVRDMLMGK